MSAREVYRTSDIFTSTIVQLKWVEDRSYTKQSMYRRLCSTQNIFRYTRFIFIRVIFETVRLKIQN